MIQKGEKKIKMDQKKVKETKKKFIHPSKMEWSMDFLFFFLVPKCHRIRKPIVSNLE